VEKQKDQHIISYFHPFGIQCSILITKDNLGKFDSKSDEGISLEYSETSKAYRVYNSRTSIVEEAIYVRFVEAGGSFFPTKA